MKHSNTYWPDMKSINSCLKAFLCVLCVCVLLYFFVVAFGWVIPAKRAADLQGEITRLFKEHGWNGGAEYWFYDQRVRVESSSIDDNNLHELLAVLSKAPQLIDLDLRKTNCTRSSVPIAKKIWGDDIQVALPDEVVPILRSSSPKD